MITTEQHLAVLTAEVLRDLGRNEAAGWAVRKAAVKMLIERQHVFSNHPDFRELRLEITEEAEAHAEVESLIGQVEEVAESKVQKMDKELPICTHNCLANGCFSPHKDCMAHGKEAEPLIEPDEAVGPAHRPGPFKAGFTTKNMG